MCSRTYLKNSKYDALKLTEPKIITAAGGFNKRPAFFDFWVFKFKVFAKYKEREKQFPLFTTRFLNKDDETKDGEPTTKRGRPETNAYFKNLKVLRCAFLTKKDFIKILVFVYQRNSRTVEKEVFFLKPAMC